MTEQLTKLRPDRDLQCYFQQPSAVAALSQATANGFHVSGSWREQFDWAVVEWSRDNVFEHPALRKLPDGDLSGIRLSWEEARTNCIAMDSTTYDPIGWSCLRIWEESSGAERFHKVDLRQYATAIEGETTQATAQFELQGTPTENDYVELAWLDQHANWRVTATDSLESIVAGLAAFINAKPDVTAVADGTRLHLTYTGAPGANGNRVGIYGGVQGAGTEGWSPSWTMFSGGVSPQRWRIDLDLGNLPDPETHPTAPIPMTNVRRLRWTWGADLQGGAFERGEFDVAVSNWQVTGTNTGCQVAGPGSRRIEDNDAAVVFTGPWAEERGNYSGGSIRHTQTAGAEVRCEYTAAADHWLYLGTRYSPQGAPITVQIDGGAPIGVTLRRELEDVLIRVPLGQFPALSQHVVTIAHAGTTGDDAYFDFLEVALPASDLPIFDVTPKTTLATDWDTDHSLAIAPERTAWLMNTLGFRGRANHYAGAMWFYEIGNPNGQHAQATIEFAGIPSFGGRTDLSIGGAVFSHIHLITDTAESIAKCFELLLSAGASAVWAHAEGAALTITARGLGVQGNGIAIAVETGDSGFTATKSSETLAGGADGVWLTDLTATPRLNRAARDWTRSYIAALRGYGIDATAALSMELRNGDDQPAAAIAQRYPDRACRLSTPAVQTNFGPESTAFWKQVYRDMADVMAGAGAVPYLQFGEVQWWYFADADGMPFYDDYTRTRFQATYDTSMRTIASENADPSLFPQECELLPKLIGEFTDAVMAHVRAAHPNCRFEVLYPPDTNDTPLCRAVNYPAAYWTAGALACLKTENFTFTGNRNLDKARMSIEVPASFGFPAAQRSHLVGIGEYTTPWEKEWELAIAEGVESVVLFALDQFCLIGYSVPLDTGSATAAFMGTA
jgi:hypothetical protein